MVLGQDFAEVEGLQTMPGQDDEIKHSDIE